MIFQNFLSEATQDIKSYKMIIQFVLEVVWKWLKKKKQRCLMRPKAANKTARRNIALQQVTSRVQEYTNQMTTLSQPLTSATWRSSPVTKLLWHLHEPWQVMERWMAVIIKALFQNSSVQSIPVLIISDGCDSLVSQLSIDPKSGGLTPSSSWSRVLELFLDNHQTLNLLVT